MKKDTPAERSADDKRIKVAITTEADRALVDQAAADKAAADKAAADQAAANCNEDLISEKVEAGLTRAQAIEVIDRQIQFDRTREF